MITCEVKEDGKLLGVLYSNLVAGQHPGQSRMKHLCELYAPEKGVVARLVSHDNEDGWVVFVCNCFKAMVSKMEREKYGRMEKKRCRHGKPFSEYCGKCAEATAHHVVPMEARRGR